LSDEWFDELAKAAGSTTSRRSALKLLAGGLVGGVLSAGFLGRASGAHGGGQGCLPAGFACKTHGTCCNETLFQENVVCTFPKGASLCVPRLECETLGGSTGGPCGTEIEGKMCCCHLPKSQFGQCMARDVCVSLGGTCQRAGSGVL
jgi:hypothetical protein